MTYTKPNATRRQIVGLMTRLSGVPCEKDKLEVS